MMPQSWLMSSGFHNDKAVFLLWGPPTHGISSGTARAYLQTALPLVWKNRGMFWRWSGPAPVKKTERVISSVKSTTVELTGHKNMVS